MHGGVKGPGAPIGNENAVKHGMFTRQAIEERRALRKMIREMERTLGENDE